MDPIAQILAQGRTQDEGQTPQYQAFVQGQQTSLQRRHADLQEREQQLREQEQAATLPLKIAQMKQQSELQSLNLQTQWQQHQALLNGGKDAANAFATMSSMAREDESPEHVSAVWADFLSANPLLAGSPPAKALEDFSQNYSRAKLLKSGIEQRQEAVDTRAAQAAATLAERQREFDTRIKMGANPRPGVKDQEWDRYQKMLGDAANVTEPVEQQRLLNLAHDYQRHALPHLDEQGKPVEKGAYMKSQMRSIMDSYMLDTEDPSVKGKTIAQLRLQAQRQAESEWRNIYKDTGTAPARSPLANPVQPAAAPAANPYYVPKEGFKFPGTTNVPPAATSTTTQAATAAQAATLLAPRSTAAAIQSGADRLSADAINTATQALAARGLTAEAIAKFIEDALDNPEGQEATQLQDLLSRK